MTFSPEPTAVRFDEDSFWVDLEDGRTVGVPLAWFPRLLHASPAQRTNFFLSANGIHWEELDEDISVAGLLAGRGDQTRPDRKEAA
ncbi:MAG: DUF2442 domain-containing protein [Candidatus Andeanibacterium colombiense]|uniref:DUF2442 domain-containing protein n=1 Tax=Candidatus Andeanibacterium colombiense TaxID=3121345 RepID=A0AAJ6BNF2_9SPHN|nr:MAG: DUF2442 domain-containing protein [Sphingomonadaceae bacterium]